MKKLTVFILLVTFNYCLGQGYRDQINVQHSYTINYFQQVIEASGQLKMLASRIKQLQEQYDLLKAKINQLEAERAKTIREMKLGYFCSQCNRSQSEIEKGGESFNQHLINVRGRPIPATPAQLKEKNDDYDAKYRDLKKQLEQTVGELNKVKLDEADYLEKIRRYAGLWEGSINNEDKLKMMEWDRHIRDIYDNRLRYNDSIQHYHMLDNAERQKIKPDTYLLSEYSRQIKNYNIELDYANKELVDARNTADLEKKQWIEFVVNQKNEIYDAFHACNVMTPDIMFGSLAGAPDYQNIYQQYTNNPQFYQANPSNTNKPPDAKSFLNNLGNPKKNNQ